MLGTEFCGKLIKRSENLGPNEYRFLLKAIVSSGIGEQTYAPRNIFEGREATPTLHDSIEEMEEFFNDAIAKLLAKSKVSPSEIDVLVVNISMLAALPSLSARIINRYKLRHDVKVYNLTGMGCSASLISMDIVKNIFKTQRNKLALLGDTVFMISFGAGFKCNSCLWEVMKDLGDPNVWDDCIDDYPPETLDNPFMKTYGWINEVEDPYTYENLPDFLK
ncbi:hypothetical protein V8G54_022820 [Vigna mungo]|uniref:FAE domain-containing protein n=1 Tax=Vigna mungo TaxID=3915 RepID=A0AAQ3RRL7_VIGMU